MRIDLNKAQLAKIQRQIDPKEMSRRVREAMVKSVAIVQAHVVKEKLSGQVLKRQTGHLARSIKTQIKGTGLNSHGIIGVHGNLKYAAAHEYGYKGTVTVPSHKRTITKAFGRSLNGSVTFTVGSYRMKMNLPERSFLRTALNDNIKRITETFKQKIFV